MICSCMHLTIHDNDDNKKAENKVTDGQNEMRDSSRRRRNAALSCDFALIMRDAGTYRALAPQKLYGARTRRLRVLDRDVRG